LETILKKNLGTSETRNPGTDDANMELLRGHDKAQWIRLSTEA
jgi:hypothetical protein